MREKWTDADRRKPEERRRPKCRFVGAAASRWDQLCVGCNVVYTYDAAKIPCLPSFLNHSAALPDPFFSPRRAQPALSRGRIKLRGSSFRAPRKAVARGFRNNPRRGFSVYSPRDGGYAAVGVSPHAFVRHICVQQLRRRSRTRRFAGGRLTNASSQAAGIPAGWSARASVCGRRYIPGYIDRPFSPPLKKVGPPNENVG